MRFVNHALFQFLQNDLFLKNLNSIYLSEKPFPHIVIDDFFASDTLLQVYETFPKPNKSVWWQYDNPLEKKFAYNNLLKMPECIRDLIQELQSGPFVSFIEKVTGISGLIVDHTLNGGGLHQIRGGGKLDIHADYNYHPITKLDRRVNVLVYLNPGWEPKHQGYLELWDSNMSECAKNIAPLFNRIVIFSTTDTAFHGHPEPWEGDETRKSIALYYYTNGRPEHEKSAPHSTLFKRRPQDPIIEEVEQLREKRAQGRFQL